MIDGYVAKDILLQIGDHDTSEPYGIISAHTDNEEGDEYTECASFSGLEWSPDDLEGGIGLVDVYRESSEIFDQMQDAFYKACFQEILKMPITLESNAFQINNRNGRKRGEQSFFLNCVMNNRDRIHEISERRLLAGSAYTRY